MQRTPPVSALEACLLDIEFTAREAVKSKVPAVRALCIRTLCAQVDALADFTEDLADLTMPRDFPVMVRTVTVPANRNARAMSAY